MSDHSALAAILKTTTIAEREEIGSKAHKRAMMLDLASTLEQWPARNIAYDRALKRVAEQVIQLAGALPAE